MIIRYDVFSSDYKRLGFAWTHLSQYGSVDSHRHALRAQTAGSLEAVRNIDDEQQQPRQVDLHDTRRRGGRLHQEQLHHANTTERACSPTDQLVELVHGGELASSNTSLPGAFSRSLRHHDHVGDVANSWLRRSLVLPHRFRHHRWLPSFIRPSSLRSHGRPQVHLVNTGRWFSSGISTMVGTRSSSPSSLYRH